MPESDTARVATLDVVAPRFIRVAATLSFALATVLFTVAAVGADRDWLIFGAMMVAHGGFGVWQLRAGTPDPLLNMWTLAPAIGWLLVFGPDGGQVIAVGAAAALGLGSLFGRGMRLRAYLATAGAVWGVEFVVTTWHFAGSSEPVSHHVGEAVGLVLQFGLFMVVRLVVSEVTISVNDRERLYFNLFENAPVSLWREDFTAVDAWAQGLRAAGVKDLRAHLEASPNVIDEAIELIRVVDVNTAATRLLGAPDKSSLVGPLRSSTIGPETVPSFVDQLVAVWDGSSSMSTQSISS